jgi:hypothetical protein
MLAQPGGHAEHRAMRRVLPLFGLLGLTAFAACNASSSPDLGLDGASAGTTGTGAGAANAGGSSGANAGSGGAGSGVSVGGSSGLDDDSACASADYPAGRVPASLLFVFDRSGSMGDSANGGDSGGLSKWSVAVDAVSTALDGIDLDVDLGFMLFPAGKFDDSKLATCFLNASSPQCAPIIEDGGCKDIDPTPSVLLSPITESRPKIQSLLNNTEPTGGTPTRWALQYAYDYLRAAPTAGERYVVLVTDGQPNTAGGNPIAPNANKLCGTLPDLAATTTAATTGTPQVKTFVIGSPGDTDPTVLSGLALNGGTAKDGCNASNYKNKECHYQLDKNNFGDGLVSALKEIAGKASNGCTFAVPAGANSNPDFVNVAAEGPAGKVDILKDASHANGWDYTDGSQSKVEVFGETCEKLKNGELLTVKVLTGCKTKQAN